MLYKPLFELSILHDYYRDKVCPDLSVEPTPECSRVLRGHRLIVKNKVNGLVVIAPVVSVGSEDSKHKPKHKPKQKPWVELADNLRFTFILKIKNQDFLDFTDIDWKPLDNLSYHFSNERNTQIGVSDLERARLPSYQEVLTLAILRLITILRLIREGLYRFVILLKLS
ncbi:MAG: hypothetical protein F6J94_14070, partial [Moorea sp. SIO1F2]|uniref:hypothetical protein n=1 Tax=Moorena sp. SIO1F2 TaxID=2607819 RepID=UPI0013B94654